MLQHPCCVPHAVLVTDPCAYNPCLVYLLSEENAQDLGRATRRKRPGPLSDRLEQSSSDGAGQQINPCRAEIWDFGLRAVSLPSHRREDEAVEGTLERIGACRAAIAEMGGCVSTALKRRTGLAPPDPPWCSDVPGKDPTGSPSWAAEAPALHLGGLAWTPRPKSHQPCNLGQ